MTLPPQLMTAALRVLLKSIMQPWVPLPLQRIWMCAWGALIPRSSDVRWARTRLGGVDALRTTPPRAPGDVIVLHLHGGGYTTGSPLFQSALGGHISEALSAPLYMIRYRLAPKNPYPAALQDAVSAYTACLELGYESQNIVLSGDSSGGGLALAAALRLRDSGFPLPGVVVMLSPWLDLCPRTQRIRRTCRDPALSKRSLISAAAAYSGAIDQSHPEISPLLADLSGLPPMILHGGSNELLRDDFERLAEKSARHGLDFKLRIFPRQWHVFHMFASVHPEAADAVAVLAEDIRAASDASSLRPPGAPVRSG
ncbi:alpha/beta hydrolase fold domain-containing protein [Streptomyces alfalfae]|uniref:Alpha/beta hydrolase fold domain-containing protein n=1 Tax=Streptomyces alfalfae TaxID=1642299 RepID=A0A7T4PLJ8_9ACTN|nr:alpha/beta hydrolase fold domain-containing protein [Streptomyces alfalfae]QQC92410.1 alpha/beta hydrolase fold domain-containing protein [Streptomyces alfalfae]